MNDKPKGKIPAEQVEILCAAYNSVYQYLHMMYSALKPACSQLEECARSFKLRLETCLEDNLTCLLHCTLKLTIPKQHRQSRQLQGVYEI